MFTNPANVGLPPEGTRPRPPVPRPRTRSARTNPPQMQGSEGSWRPTRPGIVVHAVEPFKEDSNCKDMIRWLLGARVGGQDEVRNVEVSQDRLRAFVEFVDSRVIPSLLSDSEIHDPLTGKPLTLQSIDLMEVWPPYIIISEFPPFVDEAVLRSHFESLADNHEVRSVSICRERGTAWIFYSHPPVAFEVVSKPANLFGSDLRLELGYCGPKPDEPSVDQPMGENAVLSVRGLPEGMMGNLPMLKEALKYYIRQTMSYEATSCEIVDGIGYLTFDDVSAVNSIMANPPTKVFMPGSVLHMSATPRSSPQSLITSQLPPTSEGRTPTRAWPPPTGQENLSTTEGVMPGSTSPYQERPFTAPIKTERPPVPPRRRIVSENETSNYENVSLPQQQQQHPPSSRGVRNVPQPPNHPSQGSINPVSSTSSISSMSRNSSSSSQQWNPQSSVQGYQHYSHQLTPQMPPGYPPASTTSDSDSNLYSQHQQWGPQDSSSMIPSRIQPPDVQNQFPAHSPGKQEIGRMGQVPSKHAFSAPWQPNPPAPPGEHKATFYMEQSAGPSGTRSSNNQWSPQLHQDMIIEDLDGPQGQNPIYGFGNASNKVLISNLPPKADAITLQYYFKSLLSERSIQVKVELYESNAVATFSHAIDLQQLINQARQNPFQCGALTLSCLEPPDTLLVTNITDSITDALLHYYFDSQDGQHGTVTGVKRLSPTQALVTFKSHDSVRKVLEKCPHEVDNVQFTVKEYHSFMLVDQTDILLQSDISPSQQRRDPPLRKTPQRVWSVQREQLNKEQSFYLQHSIANLNETLKPLKAVAEIEESGTSKWLNIKPLEGSSEVADWEKAVTEVQKEHLTGLCVETIAFPKEAKGDVLSHVMTAMETHPTSIQIVTRANETITIAGRRDIIDNVREEVTEISLTHQITTVSISLPRKNVKFLKMFCEREFTKLQPAVVDFKFIPEENIISVTANPNGHGIVLAMIEEQTKTIQEKDLRITFAAYKLLSTTRGAKKLTEVLGVTASQLVCDLEEGPTPDGTPGYFVCLLSRNAELCKKTRKSLKLYIHEETFETSKAKIRVCSSKEWRDLIEKLTGEYFVMITAREEPATITVTGEKIICADIAAKIRKFLEKHTNVEERITLSKNEWRVVSTNFVSEIEGVKQQAKGKNVKVVWPKETSVESTLPILIQGEPDFVDDIKVQVEMLTTKVCKKVSRVAGVPAIVQVLDSMEDRISTIENRFKAAIEVCLEKGDNGGAAEATGELPRKVCSATSPNGVRVSIYTGDITHHQHVGVIVNFVTPDPDPQVGNLKFLLEAGGGEALNDFTTKASQFMRLSPAENFKTKQGQLKCSQLLHCVLPPWNSSESDETKIYFLEETLKKATQSASVHGSILITPLTATPFHYPINVFVRQVMEVLTTGHATSDLHIYVEAIRHAKEFEEMLLAKKFQVHTTVPLSSPMLGCKQNHQAAAQAKTISSPISSFITLVNGDLLQQQADVYINSTNTNMDLKQGQLSKLLLNACGDELQRECSEYAPLKPGQVAVTGARNLKCQHIFHIALADYKMASSERLFRETVQKILRIAKDMSVTSIAVPSLGVANLRYPAGVCARILFQEVVAFYSRSPGSVQKFIFVIYEKKVYQAFSKEYAQQMSDGAGVPQGSHDPSQAAVANKKEKTSQPTGTGTTLLKIIQGNIAEENTDIIVNTTTEDMQLTQTAVSKAILAKAGQGLQTTCTQFVQNGMKLDHGQTVTTPSYGSLRCKKIIHAHVPYRAAATRSLLDYSQLIEGIVDDCLQKADKDGFQSISFPAFGLGGGGYSVDEVASPMLKAFKRFGQSSPKSLKMIRVVIYDQGLHTQFKDFYCRFFGRDASVPAPSPSFISRILGNAGSSNADAQDLQSCKGSPTVQVPSISPIWALSHSVPNPVAVFQIFASTDANCTAIEGELKDAIKKKAVTEYIKNAEMVEHLIDDDIKDMVDVGDKLGVQVKVMPKIKEIQISGEKAKVMEAVVKVKEILTEVERCMGELKMYEWQSEDGGSFEAYPPEASIRLERAFNKKLDAIELIVEGVAVVIQFQENVEISKTTGSRREVRRMKRRASVEYPPTWEPDPQQQAGKKEAMLMFDVPPGTQEYCESVKEFEECLNKHNWNFTIEKLQRIQNRIEYSKHVTLRDSVQEKHHKKALVKRLFHGSNKDSLQLIAFQGFNRNFAADANAAFFGKGVYFAVDAAYSAQEKYSKPDDAGLQYMFVCSVIVGKYTKGTQAMKVAPPLTPGSKEVYDTLVDNEQMPTIFVAMSDAQAYPEYLITFKIDKSKK